MPGASRRDAPPVLLDGLYSPKGQTIESFSKVHARSAIQKAEFAGLSNRSLNTGTASLVDAQTIFSHTLPLARPINPPRVTRSCRVHAAHQQACRAPCAPVPTATRSRLAGRRC